MEWIIEEPCFEKHLLVGLCQWRWWLDQSDSWQRAVEFPVSGNKLQNYLALWRNLTVLHLWNGILQSQVSYVQAPRYWDLKPWQRKYFPTLYLRLFLWNTIIAIHIFSCKDWDWVTSHWTLIAIMVPMFILLNQKTWGAWCQSTHFLKLYTL